ncbi:serine hydrolase domain-containing protein [Clostridium hydrogenum]|uniref:serine hydrolase domain-containing protein n=1 Tax=Clostridium hydrogenum TaxID=2855764 RepID=UPI001F486854|nr:serine hydrolase domain-containing protein [Clostridium hydrogenum]
MNKKIKHFVISLICSIIIFNLLGASIAMAKGNIKNFKNKMDSLVPELLKRYNVPGAAIGIIQNGKVVYILNYGMADKSKGKAVDNNTIFQVGSVSKTLAACGVMHLVEEGKIKLDDPAEKYLTRWHLPASKFNKNDVTIRRLLSHTAGLSIHGYAGTKPGKKLDTLEESLSKGVKIIVKPGSEFLYSGGGYTLLQLIIEEVTKKPFDKYMYEEILKPFGMGHSTYSNNITNSNMSKAYGVLEQTLPNYNFTEEAAAGLKTTIPDFSKFILAMMDGNNGEARGRSILKSQSIDLMFTPVKSDYGFGFFNDKLLDGNTLISHGGANIGWRAQYGMIPEKKDGLIIFTNSDNGQNLIDDIFNYWEQYETGTMPQQYYTNKKLRSYFLYAAAALVVLLGIYILFFAVKLKSGERIFFSKNTKKSYVKLSIRVIMILLFTGIWCVFFYILDAASMMPYGFNKITCAIIMWSVVLFIAGFFPKVSSSLKK